MSDHLEKALERWETEFQPDRDLADRVRATARDAEGYAPRRPATVAAWIGNAFSRPGLAACFAAVFVLVGFGVSQLLYQGMGRRSEEATISYRLSIDPLYRLQAMAGANEFANRSLAPMRETPEATPVLLAGLGWLQGELNLSKEQMTRVTELHSEYEASFDELFGQLLESHRAYREFDRSRMSNDVIDYFGLYDLLQKQKELSEESIRLTEELMREVEKVVTPSQRSRYRELLETVYPDSLVEAIPSTNV